MEAIDRRNTKTTATQKSRTCTLRAMGQLGGRQRRTTTLLVGALVMISLVCLAAAAAGEKQPQEPEGQNFLTSYQRRAAGAARLRRRAAPSLSPSPSPSPASNKQLLELGDEQVLRRSQLPELIGQAHQDKTFERALLRMLINASQRSGPSANVSPAASPQAANWQLDNDLSLTQYNQVGGEFVPVRMARMEQPMPSQQQLQDLASLDGTDLSSLTATINQLNLGQLQPLDQLTNALIAQQQSQQQQQFPAIDKREYVKPCSFNSISCVRNPFRARL